MTVESLSPTTVVLEDWNAGVEPGATYTFDLMHFPHPLTPLFNSSMGPSFATGATAGFKEIGVPIDHIAVLSRNHYHFESWVMSQPGSPEEAQAMGQAAEAAMQMEIGRMMARWQGEHLPSILAHHKRLREFEVETASPAALRVTLQDAQAIQIDLWSTHFKIVAPMMLAMQLFDELYSDLFGGDESDGHALLVGSMSESVKAGIGLSDLAISARNLGLEHVFAENATDDLVAALGGSDAGKAFLDQLNEYLASYGLRQDLFDYGTPTWLEDPSIALANVRNYLRSGHDARADQEAMARSAEAALVEARARLASYPEAVRGQFEAMLQFGRQGAFLQEEHNFFIDQQAIALFRLFYLRIGQRFVDAGLLDRADDVLMLELSELDAALTGLTDAASASHLRDLVARRREELAVAATLTPPPFLGEPPAGPPPMNNPMERGMVRFFGGPPQASAVEGQLKGNPGSKGSASGIARVARTLEEAGSLQPGEVLVAITTMPAWTPLFGVAAAIVTETGGALSHCAIVAREYGIPAVVGAFGATTAISTGMRVTVDGSTGLVTIDG